MSYALTLVILSDTFPRPTQNESDREGTMVMMFLLPQWLSDDDKTRMREDTAASTSQITQQFHHL